MLNALYIEQIQSFPDTTITLFNSKKLIVRESEARVAQLMKDFYQGIGLRQCQKEVGEIDE